MPKTKSLSEMTDKENAQYWENVAGKILLGETITKVRYMTDKEQNDFDWYAKGLIIFFQSGLEIMISSDDEGNAPGAVFTSDKDNPVLPVLHR